MLYLVVLSVSFCLAQCSKPVNPDDLPQIELVAENVISREVWLRVRFVNVEAPREFVVERDGKQIAVGRVSRGGGFQTTGQKTDTLQSFLAFRGPARRPCRLTRREVW